MHDPEGVEKRHAHNKMIENRLCEVEVNYLGHLFVGDLVRFAMELGGGPPDVRAQLVSIAKRISSSSCLCMSELDYEEAFESCSNCACSWQEALDNECLLKVGRLLRKHVRAGMLYSE